MKDTRKFSWDIVIGRNEESVLMELEGDDDSFMFKGFSPDEAIAIGNYLIILANDIKEENDE